MVWNERQQTQQLLGVLWDLLDPQAAASGVVGGSQKSSDECQGGSWLCIGRAGGIIGSWQALAASHELCHLLLIRGCIKVLDWADSWQSRGKNPQQLRESLHKGPPQGTTLPIIVFHWASNGIACYATWNLLLHFWPSQWRKKTACKTYLWVNVAKR